MCAEQNNFFLFFAVFLMYIGCANCISQV